MSVSLAVAIGLNVKRRRERKSKSQKELALAVNVGINSIISFEKAMGGMTVNLLEPLGQALDVQVSTLIQEAEFFAVTGKWPIASEMTELKKPEPQTWLSSLVVHRIRDDEEEMA